MDLKRRKQLDELTERDVETCSFWEFALDEEEREGQDETTVRPNPDWCVGAGLCAVHAEFRFADGTVKQGFILHEGAMNTGDERGQEIPDPVHNRYEPTIVIDSEHIPFSYGLSPPSSEDLRVIYAVLGKTRDQVFPLSYSADIPHGQPVSGEILGFSYRVREKRGFFSRPQDVVKIIK